MKGTVFKYGKEGDPLIKPKAGGKTVVLKFYGERPAIGAEVEYLTLRESKSVTYGIQDRALPKLDTKYRTQQQKQPQSTGDPLEDKLAEIKNLWDTNFVMHMDNEAKIGFPKSLKDIKNKYRRRDYDGAAAIAHKNYEWALWGSEVFELSKVGTAYFPMFQKFKELETLIRDAA